MAISLGSWSSVNAGSRLDLTQYKLNFQDEFDEMSIASSGGTPATWYSSARTGFGSATFTTPDSPVSPFSVSDGALTIRMQEVDGQWQSGLIQSVDSTGKGFAQQYGYFEIRAKFPAGAGSWPAFWLISSDSTQPRYEIDVIEAYGGNDHDGHHTAVHVRTDTEHAWTSDYNTVSGSMFDGQYHTYGTMVTPGWVITYYDGIELARLPTNGYFSSPLYMIANLAMLPSEEAKASGIYDMSIDYIRAYANPNTTALRLTGTDANDVLKGTSFDDTLNGGAGNDSMTGGAGSDTYHVDCAGDRVYEAKVAGTDQVFSSVSFSLAGQYIENLNLTGTGHINGSGTKYANVIIGNSGNNVLNGGGGADILRGGAGDDTYCVDHVEDRVYEANGAGYDHVLSSVTFSLAGQYLDKLTLTGAGHVSGTGNGYANLITGNSGNNQMNGGSGVDTLAGGGGNDTLTGGAAGETDSDFFVFDSPLNGSTNVDRITDFDFNKDQIWLSVKVFTGVGPLGGIAKEAFHAGTAAAAADDRIVYDASTGSIHFDPDGNGPAAQIKFAQLNAGAVLAFDDFRIV